MGALEKLPSLKKPLPWSCKKYSIAWSQYLKMIERTETKMHNPPHPGLTIRGDVLPALGLDVTQAVEQSLTDY